MCENKTFTFVIVFEESLTSSDNLCIPYSSSFDPDLKESSFDADLKESSFGSNLHESSFEIDFSESSFEPGLKE